MCWNFLFPPPLGRRYSPILPAPACVLPSAEKLPLTIPSVLRYSPPPNREGAQADTNPWLARADRRRRSSKSSSSNLRDSSLWCRQPFPRPLNLKSNFVLSGAGGAFADAVGVGGPLPQEPRDGRDGGRCAAGRAVLRHRSAPLCSRRRRCWSRKPAPTTSIRRSPTRNRCVRTPCPPSRTWSAAPRCSRAP